MIEVEKSDSKIPVGKYECILKLLAKLISLFTQFGLRCQCGCCQPMPTARESICCQEIDNMRVLLDGDPVPACITQHPDFQSACLCRAVLIIAYHSHRYRYGTGDIPSDENR